MQGGRSEQRERDGEGIIGVWGLLSAHHEWRGKGGAVSAILD